VEVTRRGLLKGLLGGAALAVLPSGLIAVSEPVRRYWQVGAQLERRSTPVYANGVVHGYVEGTRYLSHLEAVEMEPFVHDEYIVRPVADLDDQAVAAGALASAWGQDPILAMNAILAPYFLSVLRDSD